MHSLEKSSPPEEFSITNVGIDSFQLQWSTPASFHGTINQYVISYTQVFYRICTSAISHMCLVEYVV